MYKRAKQAFDQSLDFQEASRNEVVKLQRGEGDGVWLWKVIVQKSREEFQQDMVMVQKGDGGFLYATTDLAAIFHRVHVEKAQKVVYVTDAGQADHFKSVFAAARLGNLLHTPPPHTTPHTPGLLPGVSPSAAAGECELVHIPFGLVLGEDGKKIK
eukprot:gene30015-36252_t